MPRKSCLPPEEYWRGTSPNQAAICRPLSRIEGIPIERRMSAGQLSVGTLNLRTDALSLDKSWRNMSGNIHLPMQFVHKL
jgi:hypothetical protein